MFTIDVMMRGSSMALAVQKKESDDAQALYQKLIDAQNVGSSKLVEMTCDKDEGKKISILSSEIVAVQLSEKSGGGGTSAAAGFFGLNLNSESE
jgi:nanoRNase/pAp phosphatase (c-di-AMP/oligoRNAs hydrolase)